MKTLNKKIFRIFFLIVLLSALMPFSPVEGAVMSDYCVIPPFIAQAIPPNIMIVLDNSLSMGCQAYAGSYNPAQFASGYYYGYFDPTKNYRYNGTRWEVTADLMTTGTVNNPIASGNFLNWATMRRVEISKKLLIGGKANPRSWNGAVTVKLDGEDHLSYCDEFDKDFDNTAVPGLIYPFTGRYRYTRSGQALDITPLTVGADTAIRRPTSTITPGAWTVFPAGFSAWMAVNETPTDEDVTYIQNQTSNTNDQVILGYSKAAFPIAGTITDVTVTIRAKKSSNSTMRIQGVIRVKDNSGTIDSDQVSSYANLSKSYSNYQFSWATNPSTGLPWTWGDLTTNGANSLTGFGVKAYTNPTNANYPRVTQVYLTVTVSNPSGGPYSTIVDLGPGEDASGIIDNLTSAARFGLTYYASSNNGAKVDTYVGFDTPTNMITSIHNMSPETYTPLGETLYETLRYFSQEKPYFGNTPADYSQGASGAGIIRDPYWYKYTDLDASLIDQYVPCSKSFILFLTDGESTMDTSIPGASTASPFAECSLTNIKACSGHTPAGYNPAGLLKNPRFAGTTVGTSYATSGTDYMIDAAFWGRTNDMRPGACTDTPTDWQQCIPGKQNVYLYSVFMFGSGSTLLKDAALYGGFNDLNGNNVPDCLTRPTECYKDSNSDGSVKSDGTDNPLTYYEGDDGYVLESSIRNAIEDILKRVTSGTAASVLASSEGRGANIIQALFHPKKNFENNTEVEWAGQMQNLWYYIDPRLQTNTIREDTVTDKVENLTQDMQVSFRFDVGENKTVVDRYSDSNPVDGLPDTLDAYGIDVDAVNNLWEAGTKLFLRDPATDTRKIMTTLTPGTLMDFTSDNGPAGLLKPYLQAASLDEAKDIINYTLGFDIPGYRSRTVESGGVTGVWKLGDIVTSTPKLQSPVPFNNYYTVYKDASYSEFTSSKNYRNYGTAYAGANDGMLHAFDFGIFQEAWSGQNRRLEPARLAYTDINQLGRERWGFIPKNVLPYLKYLADVGYCHIFSVDASPVIFDAAINATCGGNYWDCPKQTVYRSRENDLDLPKTSWRTVLVGSLRLGGACRSKNDAACTDCVRTPGVDLNNDLDTNDAGEGDVGYSSYFALDITDQENPVLLWEYADSELGYSTAGPAFMRISARTNNGAASEPDGTKNGRWFVVLASGPTGPINTAKRQFAAHSDKPLKVVVLDLKTGTRLADIKTLHDGTTIPNAFAGSLLGGKIDYDLDYQDDALYFGYTTKCAADNNFCDAGTWTDGGVLRLTTNEDLSGTTLPTTALTPDGNWKLSSVMSGIGPVTASVANLIVRGSTGTAKQGWLYYGTGRYFFRDDDLKSQRILFGIQEPCIKFMGGFDPTCRDSRKFCTTPIAGLGPDVCEDLINVTTGVELDPAVIETKKGWYLNLEGPDNTNDVAGGISHGVNENITATAERVMTDPVAVPNGAVFFTTFAPTADICSFGGNTFLWRVKYDTGSFISMSGSALLQLSTGEIKELDMETAFADKIAVIDSNVGDVGEGGLEGPQAGRRTGAMIGVPPVGQGLSLVISPTPIDRIIHIKKR